MFKIQTLNTIATIGLDQFPKDQYVVSSDMQHPDAILVRSAVMHDIPIPGSVKVVGRAGTGVNNIPVEKLTKLGIPVMNAVGANANAVRELVLAGMLLASRNICQAWDYVRQLKDESIDKKIEQEKKQFIGFELQGKTLGIIGLGNIGVKVANAAISLGMKVIGYDPSITVNRAWELSSNVLQAHQLDELLKKSDFISFHVPLTASTKNMLNGPELSLMKEGVIILNFAREGIIHTPSLIEGLNNKKIKAYVTDFPTLDIKDHPSVINLPHLGASTKEAEENCALMIVKQVRDFLEKGNIVNAVNFPTIVMPNNPEGERVAIVNQNIPNIVAQISSKLAEAGLNINSLLNGSKEAIAYTLVDVNGKLSDDLLKKLSAIQGVVHVRKIT